MSKLTGFINTAGAWPQQYPYLQSIADYNQGKQTNGQWKVQLSQAGGHPNNGLTQRIEKLLALGNVTIARGNVDGLNHFVFAYLPQRIKVPTDHSSS